MTLFQLFVSFLQVGLFSIGGGYAAMPLIQSQVVERYAWLTMGEFADLVTIAEMTPGPIAVNAATDRSPSTPPRSSASASRASAARWRPRSAASCPPV